MGPASNAWCPEERSEIWTQTQGKPRAGADGGWSDGPPSQETPRTAVAPGRWQTGKQGSFPGASGAMRGRILLLPATHLQPSAGADKTGFRADLAEQRVWAGLILPVVKLYAGCRYLNESHMKLFYPVQRGINSLIM